ncbi:MAG: aminopeptidase N [Rhodoluna sp.]|nr:aminopeptidase N [Rhodoluna sp.]
MPAENLTRLEAIERAELVEVLSYTVELDLLKGEEVFGATTTVKFNSHKIGASIFIDAITKTVHRVTLNGKDLDVSAVSDGIRIQLDNLQAENELVVVSDNPYMNTGEGLHRFVDPVDQEVYLYTQFEVPDSRRMFAVFEQPDLKATFQFTVSAPSKWKVISNSPTPTAVDRGDGTAVWVFAPTPRISSYITALIAGPYSEWRDHLTSSDGRTIPLGVYGRSSLAKYIDADYLFEKTKAGFVFFEEQFQYPYPFEKYDQLFVPDFNAGAMENAGAVTITESYVFRGAVNGFIKERRIITVLHELAHMWFGDLVTMRWWNDLWLNESFAEYASYLATAEATEFTEAWTTFTSHEKSWAYREDQMPSTHPVVANIRDLEDVQVNFDAITYAKGGSVLRQLVAWVGQENFMKGLASYFKKHAFGNAELVDLLTELELTSGRELRDWSKLWLETSGVNTLKAELTEGADGNISAFSVIQTHHVDYPTLRPHRLGIGYYNNQNGKLVRTHRVEIDIDGAKTEVPELVGTKRPDLILLNDGDLAYAKLRMDDRSWQTTLDHLADFTDSQARALLWGAAWDSTRDAEADPKDFIHLVLKNIATESNATAMMTLLNQLVTVQSMYLKPDNRAEYKGKIGDALLKMARAAAAGSEAQLQFLKFTPRFASTPEHATALRGILSGEEKLAGLEIDTDLKWDLLTGLVVLGAADVAEIDAMLATDNTANGQKAAALAKASVPTAEAKASVWHTAVETNDWSNTILQYSTIGFSRGANIELLAPYVEKYFQDVLKMWNTKTFKMAEYAIVNLYPISIATKELADKTRAFLDTPEITAIPALRRLLVENLDPIDRALKVQAKDN